MMLNQTQILSPQMIANGAIAAGIQHRVGRMQPNTTNVTPQNRKHASNNGQGNNSRSNILSNKALAYLNSKKATSILKNYEDAINNPKFLNMNQSKNIMKKQNDSSQSNISYERG